VEEFVEIVKKLIAFSEGCFEVKEQLREVYDGSNQIRIVMAGISIRTV
jgi:hypothetical protein